MAKVKLSLLASPTFKAVVNIPVAGKKAGEPVEFTFKARNKSAFKDFIEGMGKREDLDVILDIACGWELEDPFDKEHVEIMLEGYIGSALAIIQTYIAELTGARLGN